MSTHVLLLFFPATLGLEKKKKKKNHSRKKNVEGRLAHLCFCYFFPATSGLEVKKTTQSQHPRRFMCIAGAYASPDLFTEKNTARRLMFIACTDSSPQPFTENKTYRQTIECKIIKTKIGKI
ncbi:MAG: hypothetical protein ABW185_25375 [Sedimenticola sp.]